MTSNAGSREMIARSIGFGDSHKGSESKGKLAVEKFFSPEFRNRLDATINFHPLTVEIMEKIVDKFIKELNEQLTVKKVKLSITSEVRKWLAKKGHDATYGARPLGRLIQTDIKDKLSDEILFGRLINGGEIIVDLDKDENLVFNTPQ
jgi:ATP-dependent Clp protease ATP-binding subunit ClpA